MQPCGIDHEIVPLGGDIIEVVAPFKSDTTAGRLLDKRGEGGYMIIMQTEDARKRRDNIISNGLGKVIMEYDHGDTVCVQYHPKGVKGTEMATNSKSFSVPNVDGDRRDDARAGLAHTRPQQSNTTQVAFLTLACLRLRSQSILSGYEAK
jgi:hypothetical protein